MTYNHLRKSMGACWHGWRESSPSLQAAHLMVLFNQMVCDGVPVADANDEFMRIDEYAEWKINGTGPFSEAYWAWSTTGEAIPA